METLEDKKETNEDTLTCDFCYKQYKERTGLWRHKKMCHTQICKSTNINNLATMDDILATKQKKTLVAKLKKSKNTNHLKKKQ